MSINNPFKSVIYQYRRLIIKQMRFIGSSSKLQLTFKTYLTLILGRTNRSTDAPCNRFKTTQKSSQHNYGKQQETCTRTNMRRNGMLKTTNSYILSPLHFLRVFLDFFNGVTSSKVCLLLQFRKHNLYPVCTVLQYRSYCQTDSRICTVGILLSYCA